LPTLSTLAPESVAHGSEILLQAQGPTGAYQTLAEIFEIDYTADNKVEAMALLGTRRIGYRRGRFEVKGTIKAYWLNAAVRSMWFGYATPSAAASGPLLYESQVPFTRYQIIILNANWPGSGVVNPYELLVNVVLEKDTVKWAQDKPTTEDVAFVAEDIYGQ
jgi:hypothetical protein